jgi:hypothetical protein
MALSPRCTRFAAQPSSHGITVSTILIRTQAQRMGKVVRVRHSGLSWWEAGGKAERAISW